MINVSKFLEKDSTWIVEDMAARLEEFIDNELLFCGNSPYGIFILSRNTFNTATRVHVLSKYIVDGGWYCVGHRTSNESGPSFNFMGTQFVFIKDEIEFENFKMAYNICEWNFVIASENVNTAGISTYANIPIRIMSDESDL